MGEKTITANQCPACGTRVNDSAQRCQVCSKLISEGYQPLDAIRSSYRMQGRSLERSPVVTNLFAPEDGFVSNTAWACTVYSMVPYLGVLFTPFALVFAGAAWVRGRQKSEGRESTIALRAALTSAAVLGVQIFLWWLLYIIPELAI